MHRTWLLMQMPPGGLSEGSQLVIQPVADAIQGPGSTPTADRGEKGFLIHGLIGPFVFEP